MTQPAQSNAMSVRAAIRAKRAVRRYSAQPVADDVIEAVLKAGRRAQSSRNDQPWTFLVVREPENLQRLSEAGDYAKHMIGSAFTVVLVSPPGYDFDLGQAASYMQLAAVEFGVGSCVTTLHHNDVTHAVLGIPADLTCTWAITFGYPAETPAPLKPGGRKPLNEMVRYEHW